MDSHVDKTHHTVMTNLHTRDLDTFGKRLSSAAPAAFPKDGISVCKKAYVLLLSWQDDDLGVTGELRQLEEVFQQIYHYHTEQYQIVCTRSYNSLARRLTVFLDEHERKDNLLIVHYGGHAFINDDRQCIWSW